MFDIPSDNDPELHHKKCKNVLSKCYETMNDGTSLGISSITLYTWPWESV